MLNRQIANEIAHARDMYARALAEGFALGMSIWRERLRILMERSGDGDVDQAVKAIARKVVVAPMPEPSA